MGDADQFIKRIFRDETGRATEQAVHFENAPEIATAFLTRYSSLSALIASRFTFFIK